MYTYICVQKFFRAVYQERSVFYYFKNKKKVPQNEENAYLAMKNPSQLGLTLFVQLHCASLAKTDKKNLGLPITKSWVCPWQAYIHFGPFIWL